MFIHFSAKDDPSSYFSLAVLAKYEYGIEQSENGRSWENNFS